MLRKSTQDNSGLGNQPPVGYPMSILITTATPIFAGRPDLLKTDQELVVSIRSFFNGSVKNVINPLRLSNILLIDNLMDI